MLSVPALYVCLCAAGRRLRERESRTSKMNGLGSSSSWGSIFLHTSLTAFSHTGREESSNLPAGCCTPVRSPDLLPLTLRRPIYHKHSPITQTVEEGRRRWRIGSLHWKYWYMEFLSHLYERPSSHFRSLALPHCVCCCVHVMYGRELGTRSGDEVER